MSLAQSKPWFCFDNMSVFSKELELKHVLKTLCGCPHCLNPLALHSHWLLCNCRMIAATESYDAEPAEISPRKLCPPKCPCTRPRRVPIVGPKDAAVNLKNIVSSECDQRPKDISASRPESTPPIIGPEDAAVTPKDIATVEYDDHQPEGHPQRTCVICLDNDAEFLMNKCGHAGFCRGCRRKLVWRVVGGNRHTLKARQLRSTVVDCPLCREESTMAPVCTYQYTVKWN